MNARRQVTELPETPAAQMEHAKKLIAEGVSKLVEAMIARGSAQTEWVDQKTSPLGRRRHCALVRSGTLRGAKDGGRVLVRRSDIDAYLAKQEVVRVDESADEAREVARVIAAMGRKWASG